MFKDLRRKFILLLMTTVSCLMLLFFSGVFFFTYHSMDQNTTNIIDKGYNAHTSQTVPNPDETGESFSRFTPAFSVDVDPEKNIIIVNSYLNEDSRFYETLLSLVGEEERNLGIIKRENTYWKYKIFNNVDNTRIVFLDISKDMQISQNLLVLFLWIALPMLLVIYLISRSFADRAIKPIEDAYSKQKEFIGDASHELKTPVAIIQTNVSLMLANANEETKKWLLYIQNEAFKMENLIRDLLFLTRSESAKNEFTILSFSNIVKEYLISLEAVFFENNIECATDIEEDLQVYGDAEKIKNLITILIDNAIKYTDGNIVINLKRESQNLHFSVYNTGIGIKKSDMKRIFDRFYRADNVKQTKEGSGLGLSIANTIVKGHKGKILVDSLEKKWARFTVVLPITKTRKTSPLVEPTKNISEERSVIELNYEEP